MKHKLRNVFALYFFIFFFWSIYRYFVHLPDIIDELVKPIVWIAPTLFIIWHEKRKMSDYGLHDNKFIRNAGIGLGTGLLISLPKLVLTSSSSPISCSLPSVFYFFIVSALTAITEEFVFRGYLMTVLMKFCKDTFIAIVGNSLLFVAIHIPILLCVYHYSLSNSLMYLMTLFSVSLIYAYLFVHTRTLTASIITHTLWNAFDSIIRC